MTTESAVSLLVEETSALRRTLSAACQILAAEGQGDLIWGHMSARVPGTDLYYMKPARFGLEEIGPEDLLLLNRTGELQWGRHHRHVEFPIHAEIYQARPDVHAIVHTHPPAVVAFTATGQRLRPVSHEGVQFVDHGVFTETTDLILTRAQGESLARSLGGANTVLLQNHGMVTAGNSVAAACLYALLLDKACRMQMMVQSVCDSPIWSSEGEAKEKQKNILPPEVFGFAFDYLCRRHKIQID